MTTMDNNGIIFLEETDPISPFHTLMNTLQQGTSDALEPVLPLGGAKLRIGNGAVASGTATVLGPAASFTKASPGYNRTGTGIQVPTEGIYHITATQTNTGTSAVSAVRCFMDITLSADSPSGGGTTYRISAFNENFLSGSVELHLAANTVIGLTVYHAFPGARSWDGYLTVTGRKLPAGW